MSSDRWLAEGDGWVLAWVPYPPHLIGTPRVVRRVVELLARSRTLAVTPAGPVVLSDPAQPLAVWAVLRDAAGAQPVRTSGDVPQVPPVPPGALS